MLNVTDMLERSGGWYVTSYGLYCRYAVYTGQYVYTFWLGHPKGSMRICMCKENKYPHIPKDMQVGGLVYTKILTMA